MSETKPSPTDLAPAGERVLAAAEPTSHVQAQTPAEIWTKVGGILGIEPLALRRRALMQLSVLEIESLAVIAAHGFPVLQASANLMVTRAERPIDSAKVAAAEAELETVTYLCMDAESRAKVRRSAQ